MNQHPFHMGNEQMLNHVREKSHSIQNKKHKDYTNLYSSYVTYFGSNWSNSSNAGTFYLNVNNSTSNSNSNISSHLLFSKPQILCCDRLLPWHLPKHRKNSKLYW